MPRWTRRGFLAAGLSLAGCTRLDRPPLGPLYRPTQDSVDQPPLIVIPGAFGSRLRDRRTGREIWPRSDRSLLVRSYRNLELDIDADRLEPKAGDIEAYDIFESGVARDFYGQMLRTLQQAGGYVRCGACEKPRPGRRNFYVYPYDFRLENVAAAQGLHELIERIRHDFGDPRLQVDVLAHSNGGTVARCYARYGTAAAPASGPFLPTQVGAAAIRRLLLDGGVPPGHIMYSLHDREGWLTLGPASDINARPSSRLLSPHPCCSSADATSSRRNRSPKGTLTRSPTRFPTPSSTRSWRSIRWAGSPARRW